MIRTWFYPVGALFGREMLHFVRRPSRIASAAGSPILFWLLLGSGFAGSFRIPSDPGDVTFLEYFFPGTVVLLVLFAAIFSTISVIEERKTGFLQGVLVAPGGSRALLGGKILGGAAVAWLQGLVLLFLAPLAGIRLGLAKGLGSAGVLALLAVSLTAAGLACAWVVDSTQGFHGVMNLLLVPAWMLSGALFPLAGTAGWLAAVARVNPLTYGVSALRWMLQPDVAAAAGPFESAAVPLLVTVAVAAACVLAAVVVVGRGGVR